MPITMLFFIATEVLLPLLLLLQQQTRTTKTKTTNFTLPVSQDSSVLTQTTRTSKPVNNPPTSPQNQRSKHANKQTKSAERRGKMKEETFFLFFFNAQSTMAVLSMGDKRRRERQNPNLHDRFDTRSRVTARCPTLRACTAPQGSEKDEIPLGSLTSSLWPNSFQGRHLQIIFD